MDGNLNIVQTNAATFNDSLSNDFVMYTATSNQNILIGTNTVDTSAINIKNSNIVFNRTINTSCNVNVGNVVNPSSLLHISSNSKSYVTFTNSSNNNGILMGIDNNSAGGFIFNTSNDYLRFGTSNVERMRITNTGLLGIGMSNPSYDLDIIGTERISGILYMANQVSNCMISLFSSNQPPTSGTTSFYGFGLSNGLLRYHVENSGANHVFFQSNTELARITGSGRLGIGISNPTYNLDVTGTGRYTNLLFFNNQLSNCVISLSNPNATPASTNTGYMGFGISNSALRYHINTTTDNHVFFQSNTELMRLTGTGRLGIGTSNPQFTLDVNGTMNVIGAITTTGSNTLTNLLVTGTSTLCNNVSAMASISINSNLTIIGATSTSNLLFFNNQLSNCVISLSNPNATPASTNTGYMGFGISNSALRYHVNTTTDNHVFFQSNAELMRLTGTGRLGIGTNNPLFNLDVNGTMNISGASTLSNTTIVYGTTTLSNTLTVSGILTLSNNLNVSGSSTLSNTLLVTGVSSLSNILNVSGISTFSNNLNVSGTTVKGNLLHMNNQLSNCVISLSNPNATPASTNTGYMGFGISNSALRYHVNTTTDNHVFFQSNAELMRLTGTGRLGIGTNNPLFNLDVNGTMNISGASTLSNTTIVYGTTTLSNTLTVSGILTLSNNLNVSGTTVKGNLLHMNNQLSNCVISLSNPNATPASTNTGYMGFGISNSALRYHINTTTDNHVFFQSNTELMRLTGTGFLGVNNNNPTFNIDVNGSGRFRSNLIITGSNLSLAFGASLTTPTVFALNSTGVLNTTSIIQFVNAGHNIACTDSNNYFGLGKIPSTGHNIYYISGGHVFSGGNLYVVNNLGIGISNTAYPLDVSGSGRLSTSLLINDGSNDIPTRVISAYDFAMTSNADTRWVVFGKSNSPSNSAELAYVHNGDNNSSNCLSLGLHSIPNRLVIGPNGNVGVKNTFPIYDLDVSGSIRSTSILHMNNQVNNCMISLFSSNSPPTSGTTSFYGFGLSNRTLKYQIETSTANHVFFQSNTELARITGSGRLGIGTSAPGYTLDVSGDINFTGTFRQNGTAYIGSQWSNSGANVFLIGSNVGLGLSNPGFTLDVNGSVNASNSFLATPTTFTQCNVLPTTFGLSNTLLFNALTYTASASGSPASPAYFAFRTNDAGWISQGFYSGSNYGGATTTSIAGSNYLGEWLQLQLPSTVVITQYLIRPNGNGTFTTNAPSKFVIAGSTDGSTWNLLDVRSNQSWPTATPVTYSNLSVNTPYSYYRIVALNTFNTAVNIGASIGTLTYFYNLASSPYSMLVRGNLHALSNIFCSNDIGIGTSNPAYELDVYGTGRFTSNLILGGSNLSLTFGASLTTPTIFALNSTGVGSTTGIIQFVNATHTIACTDSNLYNSLGRPSTGHHMYYQSGGHVFAGGNVYIVNNVGIGKSNPIFALDISGMLSVGSNPQGSIRIQGSGDVRYHCYNNGAVNEWLWGQKSFTNHNWTLSTVVSTVETDAITVTSSRNVGIGISSPIYPLDVSGSGRIGTSLLIKNGSNDIPTRLISAYDFTMTSNADTRWVVFGKSNSPSNSAELAYVHNGDNNSSNYMSLGLHSIPNRLVIGPNGNVGVKNTFPRYDLDVTGSIKASSTLYTTNINGINESNILNYDGTTLRIRNPTLGNCYINNDINSFLSLNYNNSNNLSTYFGTTAVISQVGLNVGIGTIAPVYPLDVSGIGRIGSVLLVKNGSNDAPTRLISAYDYSMTSNADFRWFVLGKSNSAFNSAEISYFHHGDGNTSNFLGLGLHSTGIVMSVNASLRVGIKNTSPIYDLDVNGSIRSTSILHMNNQVNNCMISLFSSNPPPTSGTTSFYGFGMSNGALRYQVIESTNNHVFFQSNTELARITGTGRLGIGTNNPGSALDVVGVIRANNNTQGSIQVRGSGDCRYHCYNGGGVMEWVWGQKSLTSHNWILSTLNSGNEVDILVVSTGGTVGIKNISPTYDLDVTGNARITANLLTNSIVPANNNSYIMNYDNTTIRIRNPTTGVFYLNNDINSFLSLNFNNSSNLSTYFGSTAVINQVGTSVGIGVNPSYTLEVAGVTRTSITYSASSQSNAFCKMGSFINTNVNIGSGAYTYYGIDGSPLGDTSGQAGLHGYIGYYVTNIGAGWLGIGAGNASLSPQIKCNSDGTINSSVTITVSSDIRLKKNINKIENALEKIITLNGYTFNIKSVKDKNIGLIAQEVQNVFPELIYKDENDYLSIAYSSMAAVFVEAIKKLNNKVTNLENENKQLKDDLIKIKEHLGLSF
jgi:Chaperone of endosialidase